MSNEAIVYTPNGMFKLFAAVSAALVISFFTWMGVTINGISVDTAVIKNEQINQKESIKDIRADVSKSKERLRLLEQGR